MHIMRSGKLKIMNKNYAIKQTEENTWVVLDENEGYTLTFCWNGFTRTNEICISEVEQTEE